MSHSQELLEAWEKLKRALRGPSSTLSPELKKRSGAPSLSEPAVSLRVDLPAGTESRHSPGILALADTVANDHTAVSEQQVNPLLDEFTVPQVVELLIRIAFECATGPFGFLIGDEPATAKPRDAFAASITKP